MDLTLQSNDLELMDSAPLTEKELASALKFLKTTNRFFGGSHVIIKHLKAFSKSWDPQKTVRILDVGAGLGDIDLDILRWAEKERRSVKITALEKVPEIILLAEKYLRREPRIEVLQGDFLESSFSEQSYDVVIASLLLHHIPIELQAEFIKKADRIAVQGLILSDLERSLAGFWAVKILSLLIGNPIVRHDGPLSVRRAFKMEELSELARRCGLTYLRTYREPFFRVSLAGEKLQPQRYL